MEGDRELSALSAADGLPIYEPQDWRGAMEVPNLRTQDKN